ncbi:hypothetical protein WJX73_010217 [Symbiochloris irregularis]|uniref:NADP-dependent oxidoreductase domain-containing protein n=1 Tax=Symbiochloris irregularis TaxID=706552 RepID=A0AAW1NV20_9CHLO
MYIGSISTVRPRNRVVLASAASVAAVLLIGLAAFSFWPTHQAEPVSITPTPTAKLNSGHHIPLLGLGTSGATGQAATDAIVSAVAMGYRHIDTAAMYGNEADIGKALSAIFKEGFKREDLWVTTKLRTEDHAQRDVEPALRASLERLQLDYVDLFLVHWPVTNHPGPTLDPPMQETWAGMEGVAKKGLARSIGISNQSPEKIEKWFSNVTIYPAVNQIEMHPDWRNDRVLEFCKSKGIHVTAYAPMSSPGTMSKTGQHVPNLQEDPTILEIASNTNSTPQQVLLRWGLQHGDNEHVSVIPKSANPDHQKGNFGALQGTLSEDDFATISGFKFQQRFFIGAGGFINKDGPWYTYKDLWDEDPPENP